ncbi:30S ribosome-binding factor RbfA [Clostridium oryzae]|uniref:Ribosome-binding factor A n=1 Tax=Clostridium oryzae TaxID=1450648 RepID=A0A1V4IP71_9CLOT|nr:30S ribosome-binding factor RbfA [Clostridium oryzae]OPJ61812.1 ribosome-binding factor A [Clostridium oryzae]
MANYRRGRINEEVRREISEIIRNDLKDPRIGAMISVTKAEVTKDLKYAKVYVSIFGNGEDEEATFTALKNSAGFIRKELSNRMQLRYTPQIMLEKDESIEHGMHIDAILERIKGDKDV